MNTMMRALLCSMLLVGCGDDDDGGTDGDADSDVDSDSDADTDTDADTDSDADADSDADTDADSDADADSDLTLTSSAFADGEPIPEAHTCAGADRQPPLAWDGVPDSARSLALVLIDDSIDYVHWVAYDVPPDTTSLPEGASDDGALPAGTREADAYGTEYRGPCPPEPHTYTFRLYALDVATTDFTYSDPITGANLDEAFDDSTLDVATLTVTFDPG